MAACRPGTGPATKDRLTSAMMSEQMSALPLWIGAYALMLGITLIVLAFRLRSRRRA